MEKVCVVALTAVMLGMAQAACPTGSTEKTMMDFVVKLKDGTAQTGNWYHNSDTYTNPNHQGRARVNLKLPNREYFNLTKLHVKYNSSEFNKTIKVHLVASNDIQRTFSEKNLGSGITVKNFPAAIIKAFEINKVVVQIRCKGATDANTCRFQILSVNACLAD